MGKNLNVGGYETWRVVKGRSVSTCSGDLPAQFLGTGRPLQYAAGKKEAIFKNGRHL